MQHIEDSAMAADGTNNIHSVAALYEIPSEELLFFHPKIQVAVGQRICPRVALRAL